MVVRPLSSPTLRVTPANRPAPVQVVPRKPATSWDQPIAPRPQDISAVIARLHTIRDELAKKQDVRVVWATTYLLQTENTLKALQGPNDYENPEFIRQLSTRFAQYFFDAYDAYERGDMAHVSEPWKRVFDLAKDKNELTMETLLLSIDVHINYDLPRALADINAQPGANQRDFERYNQLFQDGMTAAKDKIITSYSRKLGPINLLSLGDKLLFWLDTPLAIKWIGFIRGRAWDRAMALEQGDQTTFPAMRKNTLGYIQNVEFVSRNPIHRFLARERVF
ncbi:MAG: hypothetical protein JWM80_3817 [Cyanobacteria bacterium RYN_339]|nr:hypothetical protein [Cyanobacteria bacterium RYN_339]